jgi:hypothetical protein
MNKIHHKIKIFNILFLIVITSALVTYSALAYDLNEYFPLEDGNTWKYLVKINGEIANTNKGSPSEILKVKGIEKIGEVETKVVASFLYDSQCVFVDSEGVKLYKTSGRDTSDYNLFDPPKMLYPNIEIGESKEYPINSALYSLLDVLYEDSAEVGSSTINLDSVEEVEVPAGKFSNCLKFTSVSKVGKKEQPSDTNITSVSWLAPGVGLVKQSSTINQRNRKTDTQETIVKELELVSAVIAGKTIPEESSPTAETPPQENVNQPDKATNDENKISDN